MASLERGDCDEELGDGNSQVPEELVSFWNKLSPRDRDKVKSSLSLLEEKYLTVDESRQGALSIKIRPKKNVFEFTEPGQANIVTRASENESKRNDELDALFEIIEHHCKEKTPSGLTFVKNKVPLGGIDGMEKLKKVLGEGSIGKVCVVKNKETGEEMAMKTTALTLFNKHEVKAWLDLSAEGGAPFLYHFEYKNNKLFYVMEIVEGKTIEEIKNSLFEGPSENPNFPLEKLFRNFSLVVLSDMLGLFSKLKDSGFSQQDWHPGNVMLEKCGEIKLIDFGQAQKIISSHNRKECLKKDLVNIIRIFIFLYADYYDHERKGYTEMEDILLTDQRSKLNSFISLITEDKRQEIFSIIEVLINTLRDTDSKNYGDVGDAIEDINKQIDRSLGSPLEIKKRIAVILFPEKFEDKMETIDSPDSVVESEAAMESKDSPDAMFEGAAAMETIVPIWDDEDVELLTANVTSEQLEQFHVKTKNPNTT